MTGEIKEIAVPWTDFDKTNNTGHFFPIELDKKYQDKPITVIGNKTKSLTDRYWVLRVENAKDNKFTFKQGEDTIFTLDFSNTTLPNISVIRADDNAGYGSLTGKDLFENVNIAWTGTSGKVTGTFKHITQWDELPQPPKEGHFFALKIDPKYKGKKFDFYKGDDLAGHSDSATDDELYWVLRLDTNKKFKFMSNDQVIAELDFTDATLNGV